ncbi:uncharacterized protein LOC125905803 isoform X1 [Xyrichtys novacula]|uniref:Uncharacterized protein LOC125905803 isoform X1 n=1 Tax=Xyrichtys novacula TaxID=13765 RepID=A0AAV1FWY7_XYRNO|nr:uncharacterized protein LOC125905803 isoform X1 [Xyrichtys novacula]
MATIGDEQGVPYPMMFLTRPGGGVTAKKGVSVVSVNLTHLEVTVPTYFRCWLCRFHVYPSGSQRTHGCLPSPPITPSPQPGTNLSLSGADPDLDATLLANRRKVYLGITAILTVELTLLALLMYYGCFLIPTRAPTSSLPSDHENITLLPIPLDPQAPGALPNPDRLFLIIHRHWRTVTFTIVVILALGLGTLIALPLLFPVNSHLARHLRASTKQTIFASPVSDRCVRSSGSKIEFTHVRGQTTVYQFDLCKVISCAGPGAPWRKYNVYLCRVGKGAVTRLRPACGTWKDVFWTTQPGGWTASAKDGEARRLKASVSFARGKLLSTPADGMLNPLLLTIRGFEHNPYSVRSAKAQSQSGYPRCLTDRSDSRDEQGVFFTVGVDVSGKDPMGLIRINLVNSSRTPDSPQGTDQATEPNLVPHNQLQITDYVVAVDMALLDPATRFTVGLGVTTSRHNVWLESVMAAKNASGFSECLLCMGPNSYLHMFQSMFDEYPSNFSQCALLAMSSLKMSGSCHLVDNIHPLYPPETANPLFDLSLTMNFTCYTRIHSRTFPPAAPVGDVYRSICRSVVVLDGAALSNLTISRADIWWYCGKDHLLDRLPPNWSGTCILVTLVYPADIVPMNEDSLVASIESVRSSSSQHIAKHKRSIGDPVGDAWWEQGSPVYIDSIGIPRGVPDEFKLVDNVAAGFESMPLWSALFPVTPIKNVDRINYLHYNHQRLANATRDLSIAVHEQLSATSLTASQAFQAVDMLMAEKGGICSIFGDQCCLHIPNNTAPGGKLTRTRDALRNLADEMKSHSGVDLSMWDPFTKFFGKYSSLVTSILTSIAVFAAILVCCGCCCIPCARSLCNRLIVTALEKKGDSPPPPYQMLQYQPVPTSDPTGEPSSSLPSASSHSTVDDDPNSSVSMEFRLLGAH